MAQTLPHLLSPLTLTPLYPLESEGAETMKLEILDGRYGPYIAYDGKNYRMPKAMHAKAAELTYEECMKIVNTPAKK